MTQPAPEYQVALPVFEGPLDLLLDLIEREELEITKVALAQVTDQYLAYLRSAAQHDIADLAAFLVIAARLIQIKSEALLPRPPARQPGEEDPGDLLARQLMAYKKYKQVAIQLAERQETHLRSYLRLAAPPAAEPKLDLRGVGLPHLLRALQAALAANLASAGISQVVASPVIRIRDKIRLIGAALRTAGRTTFGEAIRHARSRLEIVVTFLAVLELLKRKAVEADQPVLFGEIGIARGPEWQDDQLPLIDLEFEE
jgi:segregation and condensation protein A